MRIGYLTYGLDRSPTGIGRYVVELLYAFAKLPDAPEIVLLTTEREDRHGLWDMFEHHALPGSFLLPSIMTIGNGLLSLASKRYQLDIVHDPNGIAPFLGPKLGVQRVVTIYDAIAYIDPQMHNTLDNIRYHWHLPYAAQQAEKVITISECSRQDLIRYLGLAPERIAIVYPAIGSQFKPMVDEAEYQAVLARYAIKQPYLLYVGGINARKNIARLFEAFATVKPHYPDLTLVIGGKRQWQTKDIYETFRRLQLEEHVQFTGYVDDEDLPALYSAAQAFLFPSLYEGFGLPPLEAMACGTPVITSNVSSLPEVVGDAALLVDPYNVQSMMSALYQALENPRLVAHLRASGIQQAAKFTWEGAARETLRVYHEVLQ
jgi:glycosyltransferase involved in cell wall biosynthesis